MPDGFYNMEPRDYYAMVEGYNVKKRGEVATIRTHAFITLMPNLEKGYSFDRFCREVWPLKGDEHSEPEKIVVTDEDIEAIFKAHNIKRPTQENG